MMTLLRMVKEYAESRFLSLGQAVSELVLQGINAPRPTRLVNGLQVFDLPPDSPQVTTKAVRRLEAPDGVLDEKAVTTTVPPEDGQADHNPACTDK